MEAQGRRYHNGGDNRGQCIGGGKVMDRDKDYQGAMSLKYEMSVMRSYKRGLKRQTIPSETNGNTR
ncbi:hypothetical protein H6P81_002607 [Aristolochia fimbriata]|uniref:Uncharacterized protein n=1 Tax=Aristolochia fimbriata TaxID=158543 RepID=A0AAV7FAT7_ARIFI|nr:hypothetical protein H6P81_002607 [Aristolochia fimbriata]